MRVKTAASFLTIFVMKRVNGIVRAMVRVAARYLLRFSWTDLPFMASHLEKTPIPIDAVTMYKNPRRRIPPMVAHDTSRSTLPEAIALALLYILDARIVEVMSDMFYYTYRN